MTLDPSRTALAAAAYIRRTRFHIKGEVAADFTLRGEDLLALLPIVPVDAPAWVSRPFLRWHKADQASDRCGDKCDVRAWHVVGDLPSTATFGDWLDHCAAIVRAALPAGICADVALHLPSNGKPPHMHAIVSSRTYTGWGYGPQLPDLHSVLEDKLGGAWLSWLG